MEHTLLVYVLGDCWSCMRARQIAAEVRDRCPTAHVSIVDLGTAGAPPPEIIGVPTYLLDGNVVSLGNPDLDHLVALLSP